MTVSVTPTAVNAVIPRTLAKVVCDQCGNELHVTSADDCRLRFMLTRLAIAHERHCRGNG